MLLVPRKFAAGPSGRRQKETIMTNWSHRARLATAFTLCVFAFLVAGDADAFNSYLTTFKSTYPSSTTGNAGCVTCHGTRADGSSDTGTWNRYGAALRAAGYDAPTLPLDEGVRRYVEWLMARERG